MTRKACAGAAIEYNLGYGSFSKQKAQSLMDNGYGWHMAFALAPTNFAESFQKMVGVETLYNSPLKPITTFYKKDDTKPYNYLTDKIEDKHQN